MLTELPLRTGNPFLETEILHCEACNDDYLPVVRIVTETLDIRGEIVRNSAPCAAPVFCGAAAVTRLAERRSRAGRHSVMMSRQVFPPGIIGSTWS